MSAKYYKRGQREFFQVTSEKCMRIINKEFRSEVSIVHGGMTWMHSAMELDALEGTEITREEFAEQFKIAASLIVLDP